jgi:hypothetical protein
MATIGHINKEEYAAKARDLLNSRLAGYINYALRLLQQGMSQEQAGERLKDKVEREMETALFEYLKHRRIVCGDARYRYDVNGYYRRTRSTPSKREVPSNLLDIKEILPDYGDIIGNIMAEARRLLIIAEIEAITKDARKNNFEA